MDRGYVLDRVRLFAEKARHSMDVRQVILFGSYAKGNATDASDIDVAVVTGARAGDWLEASAQLFRLRRDIDLAIEPVLVDSTTDRSGFLEEIRRTGELVYDSNAP